MVGQPPDLIEGGGGVVEAFQFDLLRGYPEQSADLLAQPLVALGSGGGLLEVAQRLFDFALHAVYRPYVMQGDVFCLTAPRGASEFEHLLKSFDSAVIAPRIEVRNGECVEIFFLQIEVLLGGGRNRFILQHFERF